MVLCVLSLSLSLTKDLFIEKADSISFLSGLLTGFSSVMLVSYIIRKIIKKNKSKKDI